MLTKFSVLATSRHMAQVRYTAASCLVVICPARVRSCRAHAQAEFGSLPLPLACCLPGLPWRRPSVLSAESARLPCSASSAGAGRTSPPSLVLVRVPLCVYRSTSTVGFPRESRISRAWILSTAMVSLWRGEERRGEERGPGHIQF